MTPTSIEWAQAVWNPTTGCDQVSPGCGQPRFDGDIPHGTCYALTMARRLKGMGQAKYQNDGDPKTSGPGFAITEHPAALDEPLRRRIPTTWFVNSMSDLFHDGVSYDFLAQVFAVMARTPQHTYQVLTKRHAGMRSLLNQPLFRMTVAAHVYGDLGVAHPDALTWPLPNVWLGTSVEDQKRADLRIPALLDTPAAIRFLSCEPLLGPVDLDRWINHFPWNHTEFGVECSCGAPMRDEQCLAPALHWVIAGGESGRGARPAHPGWFRDLRDQCADASVPFFMKQAGSELARQWGCASRKGEEPNEWPEAFPRDFPLVVTQ